MRFFRDILKVKTVWVEKRDGQWARRRRLHPVLNIFFWGGVLAVAALLGSKLIGSSSAQNPQSLLNTNKVAQVSEESGADTEEPPEFVTETDASIMVTVLTEDPETAESTSIQNLNAANAEVPPATRLQAMQAMQIPEAPVSSNFGDYWIQIDKSDYTLSLFKGNQIIREYLIAVGRNSGDKQYVGDNRTPEGDFRVISIENAASWSHDFRDGKGKIRGAYGPWFIRLSAKGWKGIGIHGTHDPDSLGTSATEGCIRMYNEELKELKNYAYRNMRVVINP